MKYLILFLLFSLLSFSQAKYDNIKTDGDFETYEMENGLIIKKGDTIRFGLPSFANQFVYVTQGSVGCGVILNNKKHAIKRITSYGNHKNGYKIYAVIKDYGLIPVYIDLDSGFETKEIKQIISSTKTH